jgi:sortase A
VEKHQVWQEFYSVHSQNAHHPVAVPSLAPTSEKRAIAVPATPAGDKRAAAPGALQEIRASALETLHSLKGVSAKEHLRSLLFGIGMGCIVLVIFLFSFFNERFIAPFIQPSRTVSGAPIIGNAGPIGDKAEIIIPKINVQIPVVYDINTIDEPTVEQGLERGVVHYADTALPGQNGNSVIVGHSSNNIFNKGKYKFAFVLLSRLENGDTFYIQKDGKRYTYQIYKKIVVTPADVSVLGPAEKTATATLITCDPPGTSTNRLVVVGEQISPDPVANAPGGSQNSLATSAKVVPGNSPSLWSRLWSGL